MKSVKKQVIPVAKFTSAGEWFSYCRSLGVMVPGVAAMQINKRMKEKGLSFPKAYYQCLEEELIFEADEVNIVLVAYNV